MARVLDNNPWESHRFLHARDELCKRMDHQVMTNKILCLRDADKDRIRAEKSRYHGNMELLDRLRCYRDKAFRQLCVALRETGLEDLADRIQPEGNGHDDTQVPRAAAPDHGQDDRPRGPLAGAAACDFSGPLVPEMINEPANAQPLQSVGGLGVVSQPPVNLNITIKQEHHVQVGDKATMDVAHTHSASGPDAGCDFDVVSEPNPTEPVPDDSDTQTPSSSPQRASQVPQDSHPSFVPSGASLRGAEQEEDEEEEEAAHPTENEEPAMHSESIEERVTGGSVMEERANEHDVPSGEVEERVENEDEGMQNSAASLLPSCSAAPTAVRSASPVPEGIFTQRDDEESVIPEETKVMKFIEPDPSSTDIPDALLSDSDNNLDIFSTHDQTSIGGARVCNIDISASDNEADGEEDFIATAPPCLMPNHLPNGQIHVDGNQIGEMEPIPDDPILNDTWGQAFLNRENVKFMAGLGIGIFIAIFLQKLTKH